MKITLCLVIASVVLNSQGSDASDTVQTVFAPDASKAAVVINEDRLQDPNPGKASELFGLLTVVPVQQQNVLKKHLTTLDGKLEITCTKGPEIASCTLVLLQGSSVAIHVGGISGGLTDGHWSAYLNLSGPDADPTGTFFHTPDSAGTDITFSATQSLPADGAGLHEVHALRISRETLNGQNFFSISLTKDRTLAPPRY